MLKNLEKIGVENMQKFRKVKNFFFQKCSCFYSMITFLKIFSLVAPFFSLFLKI